MDIVYQNVSYYKGTIRLWNVAPIFTLGNLCCEMAQLIRYTAGDQVDKYSII